MTRPKSKTYRNRIDAALGIDLGFLAEIQKTSSLTRQRTKQRARWQSHLKRKEAAQ